MVERAFFSGGLSRLHPLQRCMWSGCKWEHVCAVINCSQMVFKVSFVIHIHVTFHCAHLTFSDTSRIFFS